jgi:hypothetical protein
LTFLPAHGSSTSCDQPAPEAGLIGARRGCPWRRGATPGSAPPTLRGRVSVPSRQCPGSASVSVAPASNA